MLMGVVGTKAALLQLGNLGPLEDLSAQPAAKLWEALLDVGGATLALCVEAIKATLSVGAAAPDGRNSESQPALLIVGLQALRIGAWQLWDHFSVPTALSAYLPPTIWAATNGTLLPYALMCVSSWVSVLASICLSFNMPRR
jgi:hypothetical protein